MVCGLPDAGRRPGPDRGAVRSGFRGRGVRFPWPTGVGPDVSGPSRGPFYRVTSEPTSHRRALPLSFRLEWFRTLF